jgi:transcriptional regulator with XRE-family HTH domain
MPRKTPLPPRETQICERLLYVRRRLGLSREMFARRAGIGASQLSRYEHQRSPVLLIDALRACEAFGIGIAWLATGEGDPAAGAYGVAKLAAALKVDERSRFSEIYDQDLQGRIKKSRAESMEKWANLMAAIDQLKKLTRSMKPSSRLRKDFVQRLLDTIIRELTQEQERRSALRMTLKLNEEAAPLTTGFTSDTGELMAAEIPPTWNELRSQVASLTKQRGAKTRLAKLLGVSQQAVSEWLTGSNAPSADNTLRLLHWVAAAGGNRRPRPCY